MKMAVWIIFIVFMAPVMMQMNDLYEFNAWIQPGDDFFATACVDRNYVLTGAFVVNKGSGATFFICDSGNYTIWQNNGTAYLYHYQQGLDELSWDFVVLYKDIWYIVIHNPETASQSIHVTGNITRPLFTFTPYPTFIPSTMAVAFVFTMIIGVVVLVYLFKFRKYHESILDSHMRKTLNRNALELLVFT